MIFLKYTFWWLKSTLNDFGTVRPEAYRKNASVRPEPYQKVYVQNPKKLTKSVRQEDISFS